MKKFLVVSIVCLVFAVSASFAQDLSDAGQRQKDLLISNVLTLRNQEVRVSVLQQLLNEEVENLKRMQAVFCDQYGLDIEKFRAGLYKYDEISGKFIEIKPEEGVEEQKN